jgi:hypothetical protein
LPESQQALSQREAIRTNRLLLAEPDPVAPVRALLAEILRKALNATHDDQHAAHKTAIETLTGNGTWKKLADADQAKTLAAAGLHPPAKPDVSSDSALLAALDSKNLATRKTEVEAIPSRAAKALQHAAQLLEPKIQFVAIERSVLKTGADVEAWAEAQKSRLLDALKNGPVQIS